MMLVCSCVVLIHWSSYKACRDPLHVWLLVDYLSLFSFRSLQFVAQYLSCIDSPWSRKWEWFVIFVINLGFYPFLWCWTIIGSVWLTRSGSCLPEQSNYWGVLVWLIVGYFSLIVYGMLVAMAVWTVLSTQNGAGDRFCFFSLCTFSATDRELLFVFQ
jgi:E3 ubiquitin-protein ligase SIS3